MAWLVFVLLLIMVIFGISSAMQSYATAQQAQATIEVARVAQVNAWGNLIVIFAFLVLLVVILALIVVVWYLRKRSVMAATAVAVGVRAPKTLTQTADDSSLPSVRSLELMLQWKILETLGSMQRPQQENLLDIPQDEPDDPFPWVS